MAKSPSTPSTDSHAAAADGLDPRRRWSALLANLRIGVLVEDAEGRICEANATFCRMWGLVAEPSEMQGQSAREVRRDMCVKLANAEAAWTRLSAVAAARVPAFDDELHLCDGRVFELDHIPIADSGQAPTDGAGIDAGAELGGCFWLCRDVTDQRRVEEALRTLNHDLEVRVAQRTHELARTNFELENSLRRLGAAQEQLIHAGKMAAVGTLVAGLSHELNNPLGIIVGYVQGLLRRAPERAPERASLAAIERQALRCTQLVRSLLDFSRNKRTPREDTAIGLLVDRVLDLAAGQAHQRAVTLRWTARAPLPLINACPQEIESALLNLVSNAIDATAAGGSVTVTVAPMANGERSGIEIDVTDTGTGIPAAALPRIFDPFFTTKPVGEGTGIGLALARQVVEGHEGRIEVRTAVGVGTTMRLWLPLRASAASETTLPPVVLPFVAAARVARSDARNGGDNDNDAETPTPTPTPVPGAPGPWSRA